MDRLTIEKVDPDLKRRFKVWTINNSTTMQKEILRFMKWTIEKDQKGKMEK